MKIILILMFLVFLMTNMIMMINNLLTKKQIIDNEKSSPFECGFDPYKSARTPFSLQFFLIAVIFIIFDVEITLLMPMILTMKISNMMNFSLLMITFLIILMIGVYHEWTQGAMNWNL